MELFLQLMQLVLDFMKTPISVYGFEFSFWDIFVVVWLFSLVVMFFRRAFGG